MDTQKSLDEETEMENHLAQFNVFGNTFVTEEKLPKVLNYLGSKTAYFKFIIELNHGGYYIHNPANF